MQYLFTERAHLMCPHMNFGIAMTVRCPYDEGLIRDAVSRLSAAHPFLNAVLGYEEERNAYYFRITERSKVELLLKDQEINGIDSPEIMEEYRRLTEWDWNLLEEGMLKITDAVRFREAFENGIGPGKAYGLGLLMLARAY